MIQMDNTQFQNALSRQLTEGGYTFLHRVFRTHFSSGRLPTVINTGGMYLSYNWKPGHKTFMDGVNILTGDKASLTFAAFGRVASTFQIEVAFKEGRIAVPE